MTHWQHPRFFAYFPANAAPVSVVAEYLVSAMAAQCMLWQTSPAATELETKMIDWLRQALGLPDGFSGVIQDSASSATLAAVLTMRERALDWAGNRQGLARAEGRAHLLLGRSAYVDRPRDLGGRHRRGQSGQAARPGARCAASTRPNSRRRSPATRLQACCRRASSPASGAPASAAPTTSPRVCAVAKRHGLYVHVDAAWAGSRDDLPGIPALLGGRRAGGFDRLQSAQMAGRPVRLLDPFRARPGKPREDAGDPPGIPEDARPRRHHQLFRMDGAARPALPRAEIVVPAARARPRRVAHHDPQPRRMERKARRTAARAAGFRDRHRADAVAVLVPAQAAGRPGCRPSTILRWSTRSTTTAAST